MEEMTEEKRLWNKQVVKMIESGTKLWTAGRGDHRGKKAMDSRLRR